VWAVGLSNAYVVSLGWRFPPRSPNGVAVVSARVYRLRRRIGGMCGRRTLFTTRRCVGASCGCSTSLMNTHESVCVSM